MTDILTSEAHRDVRARAIAFYLPQFYPTPENDAWWGKGFTEWTNVAKARPLFPGHYQPHLPADLGFYDLRVPETRAEQAQMARQHGIEGFCYWHYWFSGQRMLARPFEEVLGSGEPDFPFCLAWANHTWSRRWTGEDKEVLILQTYSPEDDLNHIRWLMAAFADPRYIRVQTRPLLLIYNPHHLPEAQRTTDLFRHECTRAGLPEPFLVGINLAHPDRDTRALGFDATLDHQPQLSHLPYIHGDEFSERRLLRNLRRYRLPDGRLKVYDYANVVQSILQRPTSYVSYPCVAVGWDTTARRGRKAVILTGTEPSQFQHWLAQAVAGVSHLPQDQRLVFLNAWNEWGEGMHLEPDQKFGRAFLEAVRLEAVRSVAREPDRA